MLIFFSFLVLGFCFYIAVSHVVMLFSVHFYQHFSLSKRGSVVSRHFVSKAASNSSCVTVSVILYISTMLAFL